MYIKIKGNMEKKAKNKIEYVSQSQDKKSTYRNIKLYLETNLDYMEILE